MKLHVTACAVSEQLTRFNRSPVTILLFLPVCLGLIAAGWLCGEGELSLLIVTTALSIDASWTNRMQMLKQAQTAGDVE